MPAGDNDIGLEDPDHQLRCNETANVINEAMAKGNELHHFLGRVASMYCDAYVAGYGGTYEDDRRPSPVDDVNGLTPAVAEHHEDRTGIILAENSAAATESGKIYAVADYFGTLRLPQRPGTEESGDSSGEDEPVAVRRQLKEKSTSRAAAQARRRHELADPEMTSQKPAAVDDRVVHPAENTVDRERIAKLVQQHTPLFRSKPGSSPENWRKTQMPPAPEEKEHGQQDARRPMASKAHPIVPMIQDMSRPAITRGAQAPTPGLPPAHSAPAATRKKKPPSGQKKRKKAKPKAKKAGDDIPEATTAPDTQASKKKTAISRTKKSKPPKAGQSTKKRAASKTRAASKNKGAKRGGNPKSKTDPQPPETIPDPESNPPPASPALETSKRPTEPFSETEHATPERDPTPAIHPLRPEIATRPPPVDTHAVPSDRSVSRPPTPTPSASAPPASGAGKRKAAAAVAAKKGPARQRRKRAQAPAGKRGRKVSETSAARSEVAMPAFPASEETILDGNRVDDAWTGGDVHAVGGNRGVGFAVPPPRKRAAPRTVVSPDRPSKRVATEEEGGKTKAASATAAILAKASPVADRKEDVQPAEVAKNAQNAKEGNTGNVSNGTNAANGTAVTAGEKESAPHADTSPVTRRPSWAHNPEKKDVFRPSMHRSYAFASRTVVRLVEPYPGHKFILKPPRGAVLLEEGSPSVSYSSPSTPAPPRTNMRSDSLSYNP